jgi:outer membrane protein TolC
MNYFFVSGFLTFMIFASSPAQDSLTVEQAVQRMLQTHPALRQAAANVHAAQARTAQSQSSLYPDITGTAQYTRIGPIPAFDFGESINLAPANNYDGHIGAQYTVYDFDKTSTMVDLSRSRIQSVQDATDLTRTELALQTIRTFYTILFFQKSLIVQDEQIAALQQHLEVTQKRVASGTATSYDVLTTQVHVASAQNQKVDIHNALEKQYAVLHQLLDSASSSHIPLKGTFRENRIEVSYDSLFQLALAKRTEMKLAYDAEQTALIQKQVKTKGDLPVLNVFATYGIKNGFEPDIDAWRGNWAVGAAASITIFNGSQTSHQVEEAQASLEAEQAHTNVVRQQIRSDVEQALADVQAAAQKVEITKIQLRQAHEAVVIARTRYDIGAITNLDLLDAETAESGTKLTSLQALYQYVLSGYALRQATGTLLSQ